MAAEKTNGIVLRKIDYSETSVIVKVLTAEHGVKSFIFQGAKRKNKKGNILSPLSQIAIEYYQTGHSDLAKITQIQPLVIYKTIPFDPYKSSIVFFMNEVLNHSIREDGENEGLFHFLENVLNVLDLSTKISNFPIKFLYRLTKYLGFYPHEVDEAVYFDLRECSYSKYQPSHADYLSKQNSQLLLQFSKTTFDGENDPEIDLQTRRELIYDLLKFYGIVFDHFKPIQSLAVLEATFHD